MAEQIFLGVQKNGEVFDRVRRSDIPGEPLKLFVKNITVSAAYPEIRQILERVACHLNYIDGSEFDIAESLSPEEVSKLKALMEDRGYEVVTDRESILTEKIKKIIIEMIHFSEEPPLTKYSSYLSSQLKTNYTYLSKIFSRVKKVTIEQFIILQKIERVKHHLLFDDLTLSEIAYKLHYSSTAHLSAQFKKITGLTPTLFKKLRISGGATV